MNLNLTGKLALVSASTAGISHAIAAQLLEDGARVIINGRDAVVVTQAVDTLLGLRTEAPLYARHVLGANVLLRGQAGS
jgi:short-subunit dehydrogenase involved in D-alanine esterification of teichoic acids